MFITFPVYVSKFISQFSTSLKICNKCVDSSSVGDAIYFCLDFSFITNLNEFTIIVISFNKNCIIADQTPQWSGPSCSKRRKLNELVKGHFVNCFSGFNIQ